MMRETNKDLLPATPVPAAVESPRNGNMRKMGIVAAAVVLLAGLCVLPQILSDYRARRIVPNLVSISLVGYSTNGAAQRCAEYRLRNDNPTKMLCLLEFQGSPPGSGLFVRLPISQPQSAILPTPPLSGSNQVQVSCFVEDRGILTWVYGLVENFRGRRPHAVSKFLFTISGPSIER